MNLFTFILLSIIGIIFLCGFLLAFTISLLLERVKDKTASKFVIIIRSLKNGMKSWYYLHKLS